MKELITKLSTATLAVWNIDLKINAMHSVSLLGCLCLSLSLTLSTGSPQLNLPTPQPEVFYNGYTPNVATTPAQLRADRDRDQRYGPPYSDAGGGGNTDDGLDDFRVGVAHLSLLQPFKTRIKTGFSIKKTLLVE